MRRYVLGDGQSECMFINWKEFMFYILYIHKNGRRDSDPTLQAAVAKLYNYKKFIIVYKMACNIFGFIFYGHNVVGNNIYCTNTKMGGRTSLFLSSQRMPAATDACKCVYNCKNLSWCIKWRVIFLVLYFIGRTLLVGV